MSGARPGEVALGFEPGAEPEAGLCFIGRIRSDWRTGDCPRNMRQARERGGGNARIELDAPYRAGLRGLAEDQWIWLLAWFGAKRRDLIVQAPAHADGPRGTFALRSPVRPNPVTMQLVRIVSLDMDTGVLKIDATDAFDGTPVLDIKPWLPGIDRPEGAGPQ